MRIVLTGHDISITDQLRAYVEYRLFTSTAQYKTLIRSVNVTLRHNPGVRGRFLCLIAVDLGRTKPMKVRACGPHPNAAIDRAAQRAATHLHRGTSDHVSS